MKNLLLVSFSIVLVAGCGSAPLRPVVDFDSSVDFSGFRTFTWIDANPLIRDATQRPLSPLVQQRLVETTRSALEGRGLRFVADAASADLAVAFTVGSREGIRITSFPSSSFSRGPVGRRDYRWSRGYWNTTNVQTSSYTEGQLAIDLFDVANARPVWHGTVSRRVTQREQAAPDAALAEAVTAIVAKFPPG